MALDNAALLEVLEAMQAAGVEDRVRTAAQTIYQALIDAELTAVIGAGPLERSDARSAQRNGSRPWTLTTTAGDLELRIPRFAVVMEAYLHGVSTRSMTWSRRWGADTTLGSPSPRCRGSARTSTRRSVRSGTDRWPRLPTPRSSSTPPTARRG